MLQSILQIPYLLFITCHFFTHKQIYAVNHYTGESEIYRRVLRVISMGEFIAMITFLIIQVIKESILFALFLYAISFVFALIISAVVTSTVAKHVLHSTDSAEFDKELHRKGDLINNSIAKVGVVINPVCTVIMFLIVYGII